MPIDSRQHSQMPVKTSSERGFGLVFTAFFALLAGLPLLHGHAPRWSLLAVAAVFLALALLSPSLLAPLNRLWTKFGEILHRVMNPVIMGLMFFLIITPMALAMRLAGKDPLRLRMDPDTDSYWIPREPPGPPPESLKNQF